MVKILCLVFDSEHLVVSYVTVNVWWLIVDDLCLVVNGDIDGECLVVEILMFGVQGW